MKKIPFENALLQFNQRVLCNGRSVGTINNIETLSNQLFFNQIFMSNTDEMFEKFSMIDYIHDYVESVKLVHLNLGNILTNVMRICNVTFTREDSFERRYMMNSELGDMVMTEFYQDINSVHYRFNSGELYYISTFENGTIGVSHVDKKRNVYQKPLEYNGVFWKTEDCIRDYIKDQLKADTTTIVKVTSLRDNQNVITKVEYSGKDKHMKKIASIFGHKCLIVNNPFIYSKDIEKMIKKFTQKKTEVQSIGNLGIRQLLQKDKIVEYPKESFFTYLDFLKSVAEYPETKKIYLTLYRIGDDPALFYILKGAIEKGIKVHVNVELFASGESINKFWMDELIHVGANVTTYEAGRLKVHSKLTLVKFNNGTTITQVGTGNYNSSTTSQYTDLSLVTSDEETCYLVEKVFKIFAGDAEQSFGDKLLVTRYNARPKLLELIDREGEKGANGYICLKCNSIDDPEIIEHMDTAAENGCKIDLIIRGVCTWVPQVNNVQVKSIVWDKLEHSRVFCFGKEDPVIYLGSLDLLKHKINRRIETMVKVEDPDTVVYMINYLNRYITTTCGSWLMDKNGNYIKERSLTI